jgi:hypothetical protein
MYTPRSVFKLFYCRNLKEGVHLEELSLGFEIDLKGNEWDKWTDWDMCLGRGTNSEHETEPWVSVECVKLLECFRKC